MLLSKLKKYHKDIEMIDTISDYSKFLDLKDHFIDRNYMANHIIDKKYCTFTHFSDSVFIVPDMSYNTRNGIIKML